MPSGSYFLILRHDVERYSDKEFNQLVKDNYDHWLKNDFNPGNDYTLDEIQEFQQVNDKTYVSVQSKKKYDLLMDAYFNSAFTCLKDEFNMNPYNKYGEHEISLNEAKEIVQAIDYILSFNYSKKVENVLNNYFISVFEEMYTPFYNRYKSKVNKIEYNSFDENESFHILKKVKTVLDSFLLLENDNLYCEDGSYKFEYKLIYKAF